MPVAPAHIDTANDALAASLSSAWLVHLYSGVADPSVGPSPSEELTSDGGYTPTALGSWTASSGGAAHNDVDFGTSTDAWSDEATVWGVRDGGGVLRWWDVLQESINVTAAGTDVVAGLDLYPNVGDL